MKALIALPGVWAASTGVRGSIWSSVFMMAAGGEEGVRLPWAKLDGPSARNEITTKKRKMWRNAARGARTALSARRSLPLQRLAGKAVPAPPRNWSGED